MKTKFRRLGSMILIILISMSIGDISPKSVQGSTASEIVLFEGWNLIGLPCIPEDPSIEVILSDILDNVESVWAFDGETDTWSSYSPGAPSDLTEMVEDKGYWIKMKANVILTILEYERKTLKIVMVETGIEWRDAGDYDLQDSFPKGYDGDFFVIYEIEEHYHELIYRVSMDIYIVSEGTIYFAEHWIDEGTYPYEDDWFHSFYYPVDIQWLSNNFYTVIVTVTDLITGESNSKSNSFTITL